MYTSTHILSGLFFIIYFFTFYSGAFVRFNENCGRHQQGIISIVYAKSKMMHASPFHLIISCNRSIGVPTQINKTMILSLVCLCTLLFSLAHVYMYITRNRVHCVIAEKRIERSGLYTNTDFSRLSASLRLILN